MTPLQSRVLRTIRQGSLIPDHGRVLVALSGGADSVSLTLLLCELAPIAGFTVAGGIHLNHGLRAAAADDERFCRALTERLGLPLTIGRADVRGKAQHERISIEEAGHRARHTLFEEVVTAVGADRVATAHTREDQAETYLMRLIRGAGPVGLSGIHPRSGHVIRPLLDVSRFELRDYLAGRGQPFRDDETNRDVSVTRNRVRHELIPFLEQRFSPSVVATLVRDAQIARDDAEWLAGAANVAGAALVSESDGVVRLDGQRLLDLPAALARRVAKRALEQATGRCAEFDHVERLLWLAAGTGPPRAVDLPGCLVRCQNEQVEIGPPRPRHPRTVLGPGFAYPLQIPGEVVVPEAGVAVSAERVAGRAPETTLSARGGAVYVDAAGLREPLTVRSWHPGDALRPLGLGGRKKVQDLFVDGKVERSVRHLVPIVTDATAGIVWVVGHTVADGIKITSSTEGMLRLRARPIDKY